MDPMFALQVLLKNRLSEAYTDAVQKCPGYRQLALVILEEVISSTMIWSLLTFFESFFVIIEPWILFCGDGRATVARPAKYIL